MNNAANVINSPNLPVAAERGAGNPGAGNDESLTQARFAEVLRGQQARNAADTKGQKGDQSAPGAADPAADDPAATPSDSTVQPGEAAAVPAAPLLADPALMALMLDPAAAPAARTLITIGGFSTATGLSMDARGVAGANAAGPAFPGPAIDAMPVPDSTAATPPIAGNGIPLSAGQVVLPNAATSAASGIRADLKNAPVAGPGFDPARGESTARGPQLPFGMAADSAMRGEALAIESPRADPTAWAAFAVPVDSAASRQSAASALPPIEAPVGSPRFVNETAQQVTWLVKNGLSEAEIRVRPADMGPISVRIEMNQNEATISFAVTQPETRAAVQDSLHRLTEMLADSGISLGEASVGGQNFTRQSPDGGTAGRSRVTFAPGRGDEGIAGIEAGNRMIPERARGLVDTFA